MANQPLKGLPRLWAAFLNSIQGFKDAWKGEEAFRMEFWVLLVSVPLALWLSATMFQAALLIGAIVMVLIVEVLNSAIEAVVDRIGPERHELSRIAKDLGSLAVMLSMILAGVIWAAALWDRFVAA